MTARARSPRRVAAVIALVSAGCGGGLRAVPVGPRANTADAQSLVAVEVAPPPAKVETVPVDPGTPCAWLDGRWEWAARNWQWTAGDWVVPPEGCHFAPPETVWVATAGRGQLFYLPGRWYPDDSAGKCQEARSCSRPAEERR